MSTKSEEKTQQILEAVTKVLSKKGYADTTITLVAAEAGVSKGLLHYYFKNKEEMLAKAIEMNVKTGIELVNSVFLNSKTIDDLAEQTTEAVRFAVQNIPDLYHILFEGWSLCNRSSLIHDKFKVIYNEFYETVRSGLEQASAKGIIKPKLPFNGIAITFTALVDGMGIQALIQPELRQDKKVWETFKNTIKFIFE